MIVGRSPLKLSALLACCVFLLLLTACATHPLGMSDEEWNQLTPEQQLEARKQDEQNRLERERMRLEEERQRKDAQLRQDLADGMILSFNPDRAYCMGGDKCGRDSFDQLILSMQRMAEVDRVMFYADDNIGTKHDALVSVYADDVLVAQDIDVKRSGKWHQVLVARPARNITLRAQGDDEVNIHQVKVYGSWLKGDADYLIVK
jgi:hypothetical protein